MPESLIPPVEALSIAQVIERWTDPTDPWQLALVQRDLAWDAVRTARLLDSLLAGYPIGSLLLCRVARPSKLHTHDRGTKDAGSHDWQLLDGQQRVQALVSLFTTQGSLGRFLLAPAAPAPPGRHGRERSKEAPPYMDWLGVDEEREDSHVNYIELSRWHEWALSAGGLALIPDLPVDAVLQRLREIDPAFEPILDEAGTELARTRWARLVRLWTEPCIPVQHIRLESPGDMLSVFERVNMEGVSVGADDVFFAAVKILWPEAEHHVNTLLGASPAARGELQVNPLLDRMSGLRLLARLACHVVSGSDLLPLDVARLDGKRGGALIEHMRRIATSDTAVGRMHRLSRVLARTSVLGHGLAQVPRQLLEPVFAWAATNRGADDDAFLEGSVRDIDAYLLGATAFGYATRFRAAFLRRAFREAMVAGVEGHGFPVDDITSFIHATWPEGRAGNQLVRRIETDEERIAFANENKTLFLSVAQHIPFELPPRAEGRPGLREVEWDHIWPQARASLMRVKQESGRFAHHQHRRCVGWAGNFWALDRPINNWLSDRLPREKFGCLASLPTEDLPAVWPEERFLTRAEVDEMHKVEEEIAGLPDGINGAMERFHELVRRRTLRLVDAVRERCPRIMDFAPRGVGVREDIPEPELGDVAAALGLTASPSWRPGDDTEPAAEGDLLAAVRALASQCGVRPEFELFITAAIDIGLSPRGHKTSMKLAPPKNLTRSLISVWPQPAEGGSLQIHHEPSAIEEFFPSIPVARAIAALGPRGFSRLRPADVHGFVQHMAALFAGIPR